MTFTVNRISESPLPINDQEIEECISRMGETDMLDALYLLGRVQRGVKQKDLESALEKGGKEIMTFTGDDVTTNGTASILMKGDLRNTLKLGKDKIDPHRKRF